jgi:hypothetical protein
MSAESWEVVDSMSIEDVKRDLKEFGMSTKGTYASLRALLVTAYDKEMELAQASKQDGRVAGEHRPSFRSCAFVALCARWLIVVRDTAVGSDGSIAQDDDEAIDMTAKGEADKKNPSPPKQAPARSAAAKAQRVVSKRMMEDREGETLSAAARTRSPKSLCSPGNPLRRAALRRTAVRLRFR